MPKLLYIEASPRGKRSFSSAAATALIDGFREAHSDAVIDHLKLWEIDLPQFAGGVAKADTYRLDESTIQTDSEAKLWADTRAVFDRFVAADAYVISTPMWNFGVPYLLKQYFDVMAQPGLAFQYKEDGTSEGFVVDRPAVVIAARGGAYSGASPIAAMDHQLPWVETILRFIGFDDVTSLPIEPTIGSPEAQAAKRQESMKLARQLGVNLSLQGH